MSQIMSRRAKMHEDDDDEDFQKIRTNTGEMAIKVEPGNTKLDIKLNPTGQSTHYQVSTETSDVKIAEELSTIPALKINVEDLSKAEPIKDPSISEGSTDSETKEYFKNEKQENTVDESIIRSVKSKFISLLPDINSKRLEYGSPSVGNVGLPKGELSPLQGLNNPSVSNLLDDTTALFDDEANVSDEQDVIEDP
jgi:hypothetical protein